MERLTANEILDVLKIGDKKEVLYNVVLDNWPRLDEAGRLLILNYIIEKGEQ